MTASEVKRKLLAWANPAKAAVLQRYFKTGPGEYAAGDRFYGISVPQQRRVARQFHKLPAPQCRTLLRSPIHEERLVALFILVHQFEQGDETTRRRRYRLYLQHLPFINNWDLVDLSAPRIVGAWLFGRDRSPLYRLAKARNVWKRRIAVLATFYFIRQGAFADTLTIAELLLTDRADLIQKAVGWMLREVGKQDIAVLKSFLERHAASMPRTMLRYAIEKFPPSQRRRYLRKPRPAMAGSQKLTGSNPLP